MLTMVFATAKAQLYNWEFGVTAGGANYVGDINSAFNSATANAQWNQFEQSFDFYNTKSPIVPKNGLIGLFVVICSFLHNIFALSHR